MDINDIRVCAKYFEKTYLKTFYIVTTFNGKSFILIGEKNNFPHLMGINKNVYKSNGYRNPSKLYSDIIGNEEINRRIIPNNISSTSKMYKKASNFCNSDEIFWKNSGPLAINYNENLSTTKLSNVSIILVDIKSGYMIGWVDNADLQINAEIKLKKYCISSWIDESDGTDDQKVKYMPKQDVELIKSVLAFNENSQLIRQKTYKYNKAKKIEILKAIESQKSNLLLDKRNEQYYKKISISEKINCKINGQVYYGQVY